MVMNKFTDPRYCVLLCTATAALLALLSPGRPVIADNQNMLPPVSDSAAWHLIVDGKAKAQVDHNEDLLICNITATDGNEADVQIAHSGATLINGHSYVLSFEARSSDSLAVRVIAATDQKPYRNAGLDSIVYPTAHWAPYSITFTAKNSVPKHVTAPGFLLGRQASIFFVRNLKLVQLAGPPPDDSGLPTPVAPLAHEAGYSGSVQSFLPNGAGFVMWMTGKTTPGAQSQSIEPPHTLKVSWTKAHIRLGADAVSKSAIRLGDLVSTAGTVDISHPALNAREIHISHGYKRDPTTYAPPMPMADMGGAALAAKRKLRRLELAKRRAAAAKRAKAAIGKNPPAAH